MATELTDRDICHKQLQTPKSVVSIMDNSLQFVSSPLDGDNDDSFLEMERQCHYEEQKQRMLAIDADNTILSEIEPPPELWENTMMLHAPNVTNLRDNDDLIHLSPMKMVGLMRPSTIVEETSSQCNSTGENSQCSTENGQKSKNSSNFGSSTSTLQTSSTENSIIDKISPLKLVQDTPSPSPDPMVTQTKRHVDKTRRTMVFKKRDEKRKFFNDDNESVTSPLVDIRTPRMQRVGTKNLISLDRSPPIIKVTDTTTPSRDQFNDTFEAVEFFMEKGKQLLEQTPLANRTILETPLFSCKRSRILSEMAAVEMQPIPKRGPLLNLYSSPDATPSPKH